MPTSHPGELGIIPDLLMQLSPQSVLDVGVGFGKWGVIAREYCDVWCCRFDRCAWKARIEGIEIYSDYANPIWEFAYDHVHVGDARVVVPTLPAFDLAIASDVIEHMPKEDGLRLVQELLARCDHVIVATPINFVPQDNLPNANERHLSLWSLEDVSPSCVRYFEVAGVVWVGLLTRKYAPGRRMRLIRACWSLRRHLHLARRPLTWAIGVLSQGYLRYL